MTPEEFARGSWQHSATATTLPPLDELRARADSFRSKIVRRNWIEYAAGLLAVIAFGASALLVPLPAMQIGSVMVVVGVLVVLWQLHRRTSPLTPMDHGGQLAVLDFQRRELVRQRDALNSIFTWYLLPLLPGMAVLYASPVLSLPMEQWGLPPMEVIRTAGLTAAFFLVVYLLNKRGARQLQVKIDEIDALQAD